MQGGGVRSKNGMKMKSRRGKKKKGPHPFLAKRNGKSRKKKRKRNEIVQEKGKKKRVKRTKEQRETVCQEKMRRPHGTPVQPTPGKAKGRKLKRGGVNPT